MAQSTLSRRFSEIIGVVLFATALVWLVSLASYTPTDPVWFFNTGSDLAPANLAGRIGAFLAELSFQMLGYASYLMPAVAAVIGWHYFWCRHFDAPYTKFIGATLLVGSSSSFLSLAFGSFEVSGRTFRAGGCIGEWLAAELAEYLNRTGSIILILTLLFLAIILSTQFSFGRAFAAAGAIVRDRAAQVIAGWRERREQKAREKERSELIRRQAEKAGARTAARPTREPTRRGTPQGDEDAEDDVADLPLRQPSAATPAIDTPRPLPRPTPAINKKPAAAPQPLPLPEPERVERKKAGFTLPPMSLLDAPRGERKIDERELMEGARLLEDKCREFAVEGTVVQIHPGPIVTTYEFKPDAGVKYAKVTSLAEDLCLGMLAESVLIDRIPGKSTVGIQIPNATREPISLRELLESDVYRRSNSKLTVALGKTIHGEPFVSDLATMPHVLIAGSTGAGKSVCINAMLTSVLYRATPDDVRLILVDPKRLELGMYEDIPQLLTPVVVDPKQASNALKWAVHEMEERYKTLASQGVRNIEQYNRNIRAAQAESNEPLTDKHGNPLKVLPFIIVVIDELADLMMVAGNEVEESICRLAQMARAVGIHLILATQRPSVDVITGLIKANLPARISFRVSSKIDSRTILDSNGAEQLLGKGDMLYLPPASSRFIRLHGPYISEQESARLASFLRKQGKPEYNTSITADEKSGPDALDFEKDDLYDEAARIVVGSGQASISYLQRRLRIGFSRAARLVDMMEAEGLVSTPNNGKREVLVPKDYFDEVDAQLR